MPVTKILRILDELRYADGRIGEYVNHSLDDDTGEYRIELTYGTLKLSEVTVDRYPHVPREDLLEELGTFVPRMPRPRRGQPKPSTIFGARSLAPARKVTTS
jgi:hypothetical protein